jgi:hypothetical protein
MEHGDNAGASWTRRSREWQLTSGLGPLRAAGDARCMLIREADPADWPAIWLILQALAGHVLAQAREDGYLAMQFNAVVETNTASVRLWQSLGFRVLATVPEAFRHPAHGYVGLHIMHRIL